jgi:hypothetical protein
MSEEEAGRRLGFDTLIEEADKKSREQGLIYMASDGTEVVLRPADMLNEEQAKFVETTLKTLSRGKNLSTERQLEMITQALLTLADPPGPLQHDLPLLPLRARLTILEEYTKDADLGEDSA